ncbi:MAG: hypothetical protein ACFFAS_19515 [Promethearchaeota archaeon]
MGIDANNDGIGDTPHDFDSGPDYFPLMEMDPFDLNHIEEGEEDKIGSFGEFFLLISALSVISLIIIVRKRILR